MAANGVSFAISLGINALICLVCLLLFGWLRETSMFRKFLAPKRYLKEDTPRPKRLPATFWGWIAPVYKASLDTVVEVAGVDAAMYLRCIAFGRELFLFVAFWVLVVVLPVNLVGDQVSKLEAGPTVTASNFTYWLSPPPPPIPDAPPAPDQPETINAPDFYVPVPPAPEGLQWWQYAPDVPPLPEPSAVLGPAFIRYGWRYLENYQSQSYRFSDLDKLTMSNVPPRSPTLWVHCISTWVVSFYAYWLLWRYSKEAVALRIRFFTMSKKGAQTHSILVTDIPGLGAGTMGDRVDRGLLFFIPQKVKAPVKRWVAGSIDLASKGYKGTAGRVAQSLAPEDVSSTLDTASAPSTEQPLPERPYEVDAAGHHIEFANSPPLGRHRYKAVTELDAWAKCSELLASGVTPHDLVAREYEELYPGEVEEVHLVRNTRELDPKVAEYEKLEQNLTDLLDDYTSKRRRHKTIKRKTVSILGSLYGAWGREKYPGIKPVKVDALEWYSERMAEVRRIILEQQKRSLELTESSAFVTFRTRRAQMIASNSMQHHEVNYWKTAAAPGPEEIIWNNLRWRNWERTVRYAAVWGIFTVMTLFFMVPVGAVQSLLEVGRLEKIPGFSTLTSVPFLRSIITAILPGLILNIFLALVSPLLRWLNNKQGMVSLSAVDFGVVQKYFIFQVVTVFFGSFIAGSFFTQFNQWINHPASAINILGTAAPLTSIFFLTYISLNALTSVPLAFLRIVSLVIFFILSRLAATERAKGRLWQNQFMSYGTAVPAHSITILLGVVFCVINPLLAPMALVYMLIVSITEKYNLLYVQRAAYQGGGTVWPIFFSQVVVSLVLFQLMMVALLGIKQSFSGILVIPLVIFTLIFQATCKSLFQRPMQVLSLRAAVDLDANDKVSPQATSKEGQAEEAARLYLNPVFTFDEAKFEALQKEAHDMDAALKSKQELVSEKSDASDQDPESALPSPTAAPSGSPDHNGIPTPIR